MRNNSGDVFADLSDADMRSNASRSSRGRSVPPGDRSGRDASSRSRSVPTRGGRRGSSRPPNPAARSARARAALLSGRRTALEPIKLLFDKYARKHVPAYSSFDDYKVENTLMNKRDFLRFMRDYYIYPGLVSKEQVNRLFLDLDSTNRMKTKTTDGNQRTVTEYPLHDYAMKLNFDQFEAFLGSILGIVEDTGFAFADGDTSGTNTATGRSRNASPRHGSPTRKNRKISSSSTAASRQQAGNFLATPVTAKAAQPRRQKSAMRLHGLMQQVKKARPESAAGSEASTKRAGLFEEEPVPAGQALLGEDRAEEVERAMGAPGAQASEQEFLKRMVEDNQRLAREKQLAETELAELRMLSPVKKQSPTAKAKRGQKSAGAPRGENDADADEDDCDEDCEAERARLRGENAAMREELVRLHRENGELRQTNAEHELELDDVSERLSEQLQELEELEEEYRKRVSEAQQDAEDAREMLRTEMDAYQASGDRQAGIRPTPALQSRLLSQISRLTKEMADAKDKIISLRHDGRDKTRQVADLQREVTLARRRHEKAATRDAQHSADIAELQTQLGDTRDQLSQATKGSKRLISKHDDMAADLKQLEQERDERAARAERLAKSSASREKKLKARLAEVEKELLQRRKEARDKTRAPVNSRGAQRENTQLKDQIDRLEKLQPVLAASTDELNAAHQMLVGSISAVPVPGATDDPNTPFSELLDSLVAHREALVSECEALSYKLATIKQGQAELLAAHEELGAQTDRAYADKDTAETACVEELRDSKAQHADALAEKDAALAELDELQRSVVLERDDLADALAVVERAKALLEIEVQQHLLEKEELQAAHADLMVDQEAEFANRLQRNRDARVEAQARLSEANKELEKAQKDLEDTENSLASLKQKHAKLAAARDKLKVANDELKARLEKQVAEMKQMRNEHSAAAQAHLTEVQRHLGDKEQMQQEHLARLESVKKVLKTVSDDKNSLMAKHKDLLGHADELQELQAQLGAEVEQHKADSAAAAEQVALLQSKLEAAHEELGAGMSERLAENDALQASNSELIGRLDSLTSERDDLLDANDQLAKDLQAASETMEALEESLKQSLDNVKVLEAAKENSEVSLSFAKDQHEQTLEKLSLATEDGRALEEELAQVQAALKQAQQDQAKGDSLSGALQELEEEVASLKEAKEKLEKDRAAATKKGKEASKALKESKNEAQKTATRLAEAEQELAVAKKAVADTSAKLQNAKSEIGRIKRDLTTTRTDKQATEKDHAANAEQLEALREELDELKQTLAEVNTERTSLEQNNKRLAEDRGRLDAQLQSLSEELAAVSEQNIGVTGAAADKDEALKALAKENEDLYSMTSRQSEELSSAREERADFADLVQEMQAAKDHLQKTYAGLCEEMERLANENDELQHGVAEEQGKNSASKINLKAHLESLSSHRERALRAAEDMKKELSKVRQAYDQLQDAHKNLVESKEKVQAELKALSAEHAKCGTQLARLTEGTEEMDAMAAAANEEMQALREAAEAFKRQQDEEQGRAQAAEAARDDARAQLHRLKDALEALEEENVELTNVLEQQAVVAQSAAEANDLRAALAEAQAEVARLTKDLRDAEDERDVLISECDRMQEQLVGARAEAAEEARAASAEDIARHVAENEQLRAVQEERVAQLNQRLEEAEQEKTNLVAAMNELRNSQESASDLLDTFFTQAESEKNDLLASSKQQNDEVEQLHVKLERVMALLDDDKAHMQAMEKDNARLAAELDEMKQQEKQQQQQAVVTEAVKAAAAEKRGVSSGAPVDDDEEGEEGEVQTLRKANDELASQLAELKEALQEAATLQPLEDARMASKQEDSAQHSNHLAELLQALADIEATKATLEEDREQKERELETLSATNEELASKIKALSDSLEAKEGAGESAAAEVAVLKQLLSEAVAAKQEVEQELAAANVKCEELAEQVSDLQDRLNVAEEARAEHDKQLDEKVKAKTKGALEKLQAAKDSLGGVMKKVLSQKQAADKRVMELEEELATHRGGGESGSDDVLAAAVATKDAEIARLAQELSTIDEQRANEYNNLKQEHEVLKAAQQEQVAANTQLAKAHSEATQQLLAAAQTMENLSDTQRKLRADMRARDTEQDELERKYEQLRETAARAVKESQEARAELDAVDADRRRLLNQTDALEGLARRLSQSSAVLEEDKHSAGQQAGDLHAAHDELQETVRAEMALVRDSMQALQTEKDTLRAALERCVCNGDGQKGRPVVAEHDSLVAALESLATPRGPAVHDRAAARSGAPVQDEEGDDVADQVVKLLDEGLEDQRTLASLEKKLDAERNQQAADKDQQLQEVLQLLSEATRDKEALVAAHEEEAGALADELTQLQREQNDLQAQLALLEKENTELQAMKSEELNELQAKLKQLEIENGALQATQAEQQEELAVAREAAVALLNQKDDEVGKMKEARESLGNRVEEATRKLSQTEEELAARDEELATLRSALAGAQERLQEAEALQQLEESQAEEQAKEAEQRTTQAEERAKEAEQRTAQAEERAKEAGERVLELEEALSAVEDSLAVRTADCEKMAAALAAVEAAQQDLSDAKGALEETLGQETVSEIVHEKKPSQERGGLSSGAPVDDDEEEDEDTGRLLVLSFKARNIIKKDWLSKTDPMVAVSVREQGEGDDAWVFVGQTEYAKNTDSHDFETPVHLKTRDEADTREVCFAVLDVTKTKEESGAESEVGQAVTTVAELLAHAQQLEEEGGEYDLDENSDKHEIRVSLTNKKRMVDRKLQNAQSHLLVRARGAPVADADDVTGEQLNDNMEVLGVRMNIQVEPPPPRAQPQQDSAARSSGAPVDDDDEEDDIAAAAAAAEAAAAATEAYEAADAALVAELEDQLEALRGELAEAKSDRDAATAKAEELEHEKYEVARKRSEAANDRDVLDLQLEEQEEELRQLKHKIAQAEQQLKTAADEMAASEERLAESSSAKKEMSDKLKKAQKASAQAAADQAELESTLLEVREALADSVAELSKVRAQKEELEQKDKAAADLLTVPLSTAIGEKQELARALTKLTQQEKLLQSLQEDGMVLGDKLADAEAARTEAIAQLERQQRILEQERSAHARAMAEVSPSAELQALRDELARSNSEKATIASNADSAARMLEEATALLLLRQDEYDAATRRRERANADALRALRDEVDELTALRDATAEEEARRAAVDAVRNERATEAARELQQLRQELALAKFNEDDPNELMAERDRAIREMELAKKKLKVLTDLNKAIAAKHREELLKLAAAVRELRERMPVIRASDYDEQGAGAAAAGAFQADADRIIAEAENKDLDTQLSALQVENNALEEELRVAQAALGVPERALAKQLAQAQAALSDERDARDALALELETARSDPGREREQAAPVRDTRKLMAPRAALQAQTAELEQLRRECEDLRQQLDEAKDRQQELEELHKEDHDALKTAERALNEERRKRLSDAQDADQKIQQERARRMSDVDEVVEEADQLHQAHKKDMAAAQERAQAELQDVREKARKATMEAAEELAVVKEHARKMTEEAAEAVTRAEEALAAERAGNTDKKSKVMAIDVALLKQKLKESNMDLEAAREQVATLEQECDRLDEELQTNEKECDELRRAVDQLTTALKDANTAAEDGASLSGDENDRERVAALEQALAEALSALDEAKHMPEQQVPGCDNCQKLADENEQLREELQVRENAVDELLEQREQDIARLEDFDKALSAQNTARADVSQDCPDEVYFEEPVKRLAPSKAEAARSSGAPEDDEEEEGGEEEPAYSSGSRALPQPKPVEAHTLAPLLAAPLNELALKPSLRLSHARNEPVLAVFFHDDRTGRFHLTPHQHDLAPAAVSDRLVTLRRRPSLMSLPAPPSGPVITSNDLLEPGNGLVAHKQRFKIFLSSALTSHPALRRDPSIQQMERLANANPQDHLTTLQQLCVLDVTASMVPSGNGEDNGYCIQTKMDIFVGCSEMSLHHPILEVLVFDALKEQYKRAGQTNIRSGEHGPGCLTLITLEHETPLTQGPRHLFQVRFLRQPKESAANEGSPDVHADIGVLGEDLAVMIQALALRLPTE